MVIDIHASNVFLREMPQARINAKMADKLIPFAAMLNLDFIWVHDAATVLESTLAHSLNVKHTPTIVVEMGIGMRITRKYGDRLVDGILNLMDKLRMLKNYTPPRITQPIVSSSGEVCFLNAEASGLIIPTVKHSDKVQKGDLLCRIVDPFEGTVLQDVLSPVDGLLFTLRTYPVVYEGSLIARIFSETGGGGDRNAKIRKNKNELQF